MTIPKQPRTKASAPKPAAAASAAVAAAADTAAAAADAATAAADAGAELTQQVQDASTGAAQALGAAYLEAHRQQVAAYLSWLEQLGQSAKDAPKAAAMGAMPSQKDLAATTEAHRNYLLAQVDQHVAGQKAMLEAAASYVQAMKDTQDKLDEHVRQHNQAVADALKDALVKTEVRPDNVQSLALLYQGLRSMGAVA
jgi:hypothetical protein